MAFISEDKLLEIKDAASIEEVVGQYVKLDQKGRNLLGLCPFHSETKPSFTVAPDKGIFYCFGCGAGGNVISFIMQYHRLSFPEAVQELARRYGIPISFKEMGPDGAKQAKKRTTAYEANAAAAAFYAATLASSEGSPGPGLSEKTRPHPGDHPGLSVGLCARELGLLAASLPEPGPLFRGGPGSRVVGAPGAGRFL